MPIALNDLKSLLESDSNHIYTDGAECLLFPFAHDGHIYNVVARIMEDGEYVQFAIHCLLNLRDVDNRESVLTALLDLNRRLKVLKFCYDPADCEVSVTIEIPVEDSTLTETQVHRCMYVLTTIAVRERDNILTLIETGIYPGSNDSGFMESLTQLLGPEDAEPYEPEDDSEQAMLEHYGMTLFVDPGWPEEPEDEDA